MSTSQKFDFFINAHWNPLSYSFRMTSTLLFTITAPWKPGTLHTSELFEALYIDNHEDNHPTRPGFKLVSSGLRFHNLAE